MIVLLAFAFLAGLATIAAPCILPVLPVVLSAGTTGGKARPLGIVTGLVLSFTFFTLALSSLVRRFGIDPELLRIIAASILLLVGLIMLLPKILLWVETQVSRLLPRLPHSTEGDGFGSGVVVGISLGLIWTPCVGPILASVITLAATSGVSLTSFLLTFAYGLGSALPLLILSYGGQQLLQRSRSLSRLTSKLQRLFGFIIMLTALAIYTGFDRQVQAFFLAKLPPTLRTGLTSSLENSQSIQVKLEQLK